MWKSQNLHQSLCIPIENAISIKPKVPKNRRCSMSFPFGKIHDFQVDSRAKFAEQCISWVSSSWFSARLLELSHFLPCTLRINQITRKPSAHRNTAWLEVFPEIFEMGNGTQFSHCLVFNQTQTSYKSNPNIPMYNLSSKVVIFIIYWTQKFKAAFFCYKQYTKCKHKHLKTRLHSRISTKYTTIKYHLIRYNWSMALFVSHKKWYIKTMR